MILKVKISLLLIIAIFIYGEKTFAESDFTIDPETSKAVPTFAGKVVRIKGEVFKIKKGETEERGVVHGDKFRSGDSIRTNEKSFIRIEMADESMISLGPKSKLVIEKFEFKEKNDRKSVYGLIVGKMRAHFPIKAKPGDITVATKTTSMGIRGTKILANVHKNDKNKNVTEYALLTGKVEVENLSTQQKFKMKPAQHYVSIEDPNKKDSADHGLKTLNAATYKKMIAADIDASKEFFPLLDFYSKSYVKPARGPSSVNSAKLQAPTLQKEEEFIPTKYFGGRNKKKWNKSLEDLNETLDDYNSIE